MITLKYIKSFLAFVNGNKTYIVGIVSIIYAGICVWNKSMSVEEARLMVETALIGMGIRHGVSKMSR